MSECVFIRELHTNNNHSSTEMLIELLMHTKTKNTKKFTSFLHFFLQSKLEILEMFASYQSGEICSNKLERFKNLIACMIADTPSTYKCITKHSKFEYVTNFCLSFCIENLVSFWSLFSIPATSCFFFFF